jgi:anti-sigma factor RsiW
MTVDFVCALGIAVLMDYLEGAVPPTLARAVESHVDRCDHCRSFIQSYREIPRIVREASTVAVPEGLQASLLGFLRGRLGDG